MRFSLSFIGKLCTLLEWHNFDVVSTLKKRRNNRIEEIQGNRNPFIDNPQYANIIWGKECK